MTFPHTVTYWARGAVNAYGEHSHASPVQVLARWEERQEKFLNPEGEESLSRATVYLDGSNGAREGYVYLGASQTANPATVPNAWRIRGWSLIASVDGHRSLLKLWL